MPHTAQGRNVAPLAKAGRARDGGGRRTLSGAGLAAVACTLLLAWTGGCASDSIRAIQDDMDFRQVVLKSDRPVLVDFYKQGGCPTCVAIYPILNDLADEYRGRVTIARYPVMTEFFQPTTPLKEKYDVTIVPTTVLFVRGQEVKRWVMGYDIEDYRRTLNQYLRARAYGS
jgi:thiol-disulfide isomerase/thioredoxin